MCRDCTGDCAHDRETDEWIVPADLGKGRDTPSTSRETTQNASQDRPGTHVPPTPFAGVRTPIPTNRDGGDRP